jgi:dihydroxyacetone kinase
MLTSSDTGDNLHFGLARLMAHSAGNENVELVVVGDDVSVPHSRGKMVGRRCLAGITLGEYSTYPLRPKEQLEELDSLDIDLS